MNKKIVCILVCVLLLSMTFVVVAKKIDNKCEKGEVEYVNFADNSPPNTPIVTGPEKVRPRRWFTINALSTDPDGDDIFYRSKWGKNAPPTDWHGPYLSGHELGISTFFYTSPDSLTIYFQAKDEHGVESDWTYHTTSTTKAKSNYIYISEPPIQRFPLLARLLQLPVFEKFIGFQ